MTTQIKRIADQFAALLADQLGEADFAEVKRRNDTPEYGAGVCASHDFCDANMVMLEAFETETGGVFEFNNDACTDLWNAAWESARTRKLI